MSQQIQITGGAKVRNLQDVIIGTSGVLSSLAFDVANGVPKLDSNGKILVSQLPNSVMEYKGTWNAATNTPTLVNGTGNQGDVYLCNVAGTVNFGAGPIAFVVGDQVIYSGSIWQRASGATGTVTSVALTESGDSLNITGSPITTSGTINIGFNGTNLQYVNGAGNLTTFPTLITSIGLSMPSAFSVANSPLTANGTIAVTGAGYASQYIRGDGTLADFPSSGGGGSSVSYYLNGGTSQGTIGGVTYYEMSKTADTGTGIDFTKTGDGFIVAFLTDANDPAQLNIPAGNWNYEIYASMSANGGTPQMYAELYKYDGTTFTLISTSSNEILYDGTNLNLYTFGMTVPATTLALTDRLAIKLYATNSGGKTTTVHTQDSHLCQVITTFSTGITALNGLTAQVQYFQTGTSGTDFNISSTTATHTFNIPDASATARGLITTGTQTIAGLKTFSTAIKADAGIRLKGVSGTTAGALHLYQSSSPSFFGGPNYTDIWADTTNINFNIRYSSAALLKQPVLNFGSLTDNTTRTYTFPDLTGTIAMLEGTQTFTGSKTFTGSATFNNTLGNSIILNYGAALVKGNTPSSTSGVWSNIYAAAGNNNLVIADNANISKLQFQAASTYTYTFPAATGTIALTSDLTGGTVTSVAALTIGTTGTDLSSSVANSTTTPVITLNVPTASATNRGALSSADWTTFNNKQSALTNPVTGTGTTNYLPKFTGASTIGNSLIQDNGTGVLIGSGPIYLKFNIQETSANRVAILYRGTQGADASMVTTFGTPYLSIGAQENLVNSIQTIGFGFTNGTSYIQPAEIGFQTTSLSGYTKGDLVFATRGDTTNTAPTKRMTLDSSGNLGLGVTPSAWVDYKGFQIGNQGSIGATSTVINFSQNVYYGASGNSYIENGKAAMYQMNDGVHGWRIAGTGTAGAAITFTQAMTLTAAGRLLINTPTESTYQLDVNGTGRFSGALSGTSATFSGLLILNGASGGTNTYNQLNRNGIGTESMFVWQTASTAKWYLGQRSKNSEDGFSLYGVAAGDDVIYFAPSGAAKFSYTVTATSFFESSDSRLKTLIQDNYQTKGIGAITPKLYTKNGKVELGYYAQDFVGILDSAVSKGSDDMLSLSYREVHTAKIYALEQEIKELKAKLN